MSGEDEDGFLGRWSRLKRAQAKPVPETPEDVAPETAEPAPAPPEAETLSEDELAALPRIEDLTEGSDIRPFLRAGVPRDLRNAALRRIWMLTPAIRDYSDPAVDYAWDWNTPGGVPGGGVAPTPERAAELLRGLLSPRDAPAPEPAAEPSSSGKNPQALPKSEAIAEVRPAPEPTAEAESPEEPAPEPAARRRHGSALPG